MTKSNDGARLSCTDTVPKRVRDSEASGTSRLVEGGPVRLFGVPFTQVIEDRPVVENWGEERR